MPFVQFLTLEGADLESLDVRTQKRNPGNWVAQLFIKCRYIQLFCNYINSEIWGTLFRESGFLGIPHFIMLYCTLLILKFL